MPTSTLTPNDSQQDQDRYDPSAKDAENLFEKHGVLSQEEVDARRGSYGDKNQAGIADKEKKSVEDTAAGKMAIDTAAAAAGAAGTPLAGRAVKFLGKIKTKEGGIGAIVVGVILALIITILGFFGPGLLIVQAKEAMVDKFSDTIAAIDDRQTLIVKKKLQNATAGCTGLVKIQCRFKGMSETQIKKLERVGLKVNRGDPLPFNRTRITSIVTPEGVEITAKNYDTVSLDKTARGHLLRAFNPKYMTYTNKAFASFARASGIDKLKKIFGNTDAELNENLKNSIGGIDENGNQIGKTTLTDDGKGGYVDQNGNPVTQAEADKINTANTNLNNAVKSLKDTGKRAVFNIAKSTALVTTTAGVGIVDGACTGYYLIQTVGYGAKVVESRQLIRSAFILYNLADAIKAGDAKDKETTFYGNKMTKQNEYGESFTDSFGYKYAAHNSLALPVGANDTETNLRRGSIMQYALGGGLGGALLGFNKQLNDLTGGNPKKICGTIKNGFAQVGLLLGGIALTVGSGGTSLTSGTVAAVAMVASLSAIVAIVIPTVQNIVAGTHVNNDTYGNDLGNANVSGGGAINQQLSQAHALSPLTVDQAVEYQKKTKATLALNKEAERAVSNPLDIYNPSSTSYTIASTLNNIAPKNIASIISTPFTAIGSSIASVVSPSVKAAEDPRAEYSICTDEDYMAKNYAADPFCNIRYGLSAPELELDPEAVTDYMYSGGYIDADGKPTDGEFSDYIVDCVDRTDPLGSSGIEGQGNDGAKCSDNNPMYNNFRIYYLDTIISDDLDDEDTFGIASAKTPTAVAPVPVSGNAASLAQQILDLKAAGKITINDIWGAVSTAERSQPSQQLEDIAAGKPIGSSQARFGYPVTTIVPDEQLLSFLVAFGNQYHYQLNSLFGQKHSATSLHYKGKAVDFGCPTDTLIADRVGALYGIKHNSESCAADRHWHYSVGGG